MGVLPAAGVVFAGTVMLLVGGFQMLQGLAALLQDSFFVVSDDYAFEIDVTAWAWTHLIVGSIVLLAGFFVFTGALWARIIGIVLAVISAVVNFFYIPYYPFWSILIIAVCIVAIWGLCTQTRDRTSG
jgi:hypothetical protein